MQEQPEQIVQEKSVDVVISEILRLLNEEKAKEQAEEYGRGFSERINELPKELRKELVEKLEEWKSDGVAEEKIGSRLTREIQRAKAGFEDKRFGIPNGSYLRMEVFRVFDSLVSENADLNKVKGIAGIFFDVNGLKAVNDIAGHEAGNEYLRRIVDVLANGATTGKLREQGINVFISTNGGDEVVIILNDDVDMESRVDDRSFVNKMLKEYQEEVRNKDVSDLMDMSKFEIRDKFSGMAIPDSFKFSASVSGGTSTLQEIFANFQPNSANGYTRSLYDLEGELFRISDARSAQDKALFKQGLDEGTEKERFLGALLKRNKEMAQLLEEVFLMKEQNKKLKNENDRLKMAMERHGLDVWEEIDEGIL